MPVTNLKPYNVLDAMKPDQKVGKLEDGNDSLDSFIRQAIGKEPVLSFSRANDSPVQWIQLLQALDYQDLPGWPLLAPPKVEMQKCDKCAREFCSPINYRRHIRVHRRALNIDKDFPKNRDFLGVFWDKLSLEDAMEIVSLGNITLEEVSGSSVVKALASLIRKPGFYSLPQAYVKAGSALLDVVQARPSKFPISSEELFTILDDASEKTFLCTGIALSTQKFVFDGEAGKIGLEMKNVVACTCFLLEQKLVKAWIADKDAEALRCQKLLMEEEEAAQKRQAELLERRRLKKLRQKEQQKAKEENDREESENGENSSDSLVDPLSVESSSPAAPDLHSCTPEEQSEGPLGHQNTYEEVDAGCFSGSNDVHFDSETSIADSNNFRNVDNRMKKGNVRRPVIVARRPSSSSHRGVSNGFHPGVVLTKSEPVQRQGVRRDQKSTYLTNGHKIWTRKTKPDNKRENLNIVVLGESTDLNSQVFQDSRQDMGDQPDHSNSQVLQDSRQDIGDQPDQSNSQVLQDSRQDTGDQPDQVNSQVLRESRQDMGDQSGQSENRELLIGSISVTIRECNGQSQGVMPSSPVDQRAVDSQLPQNKIVQEKHTKSDSGQCCTNRSVKHWRPVSKHDAENTATVKDDVRVADTVTVTNIEVVDQASTDEFCATRLSTDNSSGRPDSPALLEEAEDSIGLKLFCSSSAEAFLTQRWKEAIAADHVRLVLPESEPSNHLDDTVAAEPLNPNILCSSENRLSNAGPLEPAADGAPKIKSKTRKSRRLKYIPKQRDQT